ncbi:S-adenosylmethionine synthase [Dissostichus eleginoides]|uniref:S-adenosylmethionine synthase n=1 Tax=Dissostichus eleginoides TaxID=100907 RepID=A0AAD9BPM3_DISEL|nr:S-adenosylmethionine synthase [Dissostichus eleginoides]
MYFVASEYLACRRCKRKVISWSHGLFSQLDIGHRVQFPCILTSKLACDFEVASLMRQRGLGNSSSQIQRKLQERHAEVWMQKTVQYLQDCKGIASAVTSGLILPMPFDPAPAMPPVPKHRWLMQVYAQDVLRRLDEIKATITSHGRILKMDSTKKVARKLAGKSYGTATSATNVGNEHGRVIMSVLTASEGYGLSPMVEGLINRYRMAGVAPPEVLYVDRDFCGNTLLRRMFEEWNNMTIRLDIWHFMRRFAVGCSTDSTAMPLL